MAEFKSNLVVANSNARTEGMYFANTSTMVVAEFDLAGSDVSNGDTVVLARIPRGACLVPTHSFLQCEAFGSSGSVKIDFKKEGGDVELLDATNVATAKHAILKGDLVVDDSKYTDVVMTISNKGNSASLKGKVLLTFIPKL